MKRYDTKQLNKGVVSGDTVPFQPVTGDTVSFKPVKDVKKAGTMSGTRKLDSVIHQVEKTGSAKKIVSPAKRLIRFSAVPPQPSPQVLLESYRSGYVFQYVRLALLALFTLCGIFQLIYELQMYRFLPFINHRGSFISIFIQLFAMLLSLEVLVTGLLDLLHLRFSSCSAVALICMLVLLHALMVLPQNKMNYCGATALLLFTQYHALVTERSALRCTLRTVCGFEKPMGIFDAQQLLPRSDSLRREEADMDDYIHHLTQISGPQRIMNIYCLVLLPLTLTVACLISVTTQLSLFPLWPMLLLCAMPCAGLQTYARPFRVLAKQLTRFSGALCGWYSATVFGKKHTIILRDEDLFPADSLVSNGMKLFRPFDATRVISYAYAALSYAKSPLANLFRNLLTEQSIRAYPVTERRIYDDGGVGVEIAGDIVLVGQLSFMRSMEISIPTGTRVRNAVYVSINGELAGIFVIKYKANESSRSGLKDVLSNRNFSVVLATRDFLITPELIAGRYEFPTDTLVFPDYAERLRLSESDADRPTNQGALIAKDTFGAFATTVAAGRALRISGKTVLYIGLFSGILGLILCTVLAALGFLADITPLRIVAFHLLWTTITTLVSYTLLKF